MQLAPVSRYSLEPHHAYVHYFVILHKVGVSFYFDELAVGIERYFGKYEQNGQEYTDTMKADTCSVLTFHRKNVPKTLQI